jgi:mono/diheme cytochrome c family protein
MRRRFWKVGAYALGSLLMVVAGLLLRARWVVARDYSSVEKPHLAADPSELGVQRGELLFQSLCMECHAGRDGRATGKRLDEVPAFLGTFYSANLAHPERGVRRRSDGEIARVLRFGVLPDGRLSPAMSGFNKLGDADVAAILGYMRSGAPVFEPAGTAQPPSTLTLTGAAILTYVAGMKVEGPATGVPVPRKAPNVEYGRYMAQALDCVGCHTAGFGADKMHDAQAFAGGFELSDPTGAKIYTKNITFDAETGIGRWSLDDFERAVTRGITPAGYLVRKPMPLFSRLDHTDVAAIYAFLATVPKTHKPNEPGGHALAKAKPSDAPETLFVNVGCASCHGKTAPHRDKIAGALAKSDADIATWILDPQAIRPGSAMPSFQTLLDRAQAEGLARYVKEIAKQDGG